MAGTGGIASEALYQFRGYGLNYMAQMHSLVEHREWAMLAKAMGVLGVFGGTAAFPLLPYVQRKMMENYGIQIPPWNGSRDAMEHLGLGSMIPHAITDKLPAFDIADTINPWPLPRGLDSKSLTEYTLGVNAAFVPRIGESIQKYGVLTPQTFEAVGSAISPAIRAYGELFAETQRGGLYSAAGTLQARQSLADRIGSVVHVAPPIKVSYGKLRGQILSALEGGRLDVAEKLMRQGTELGIVWPKKLPSRSKGVINTKKGQTRITSLMDLFGASRVDD